VTVWETFAVFVLIPLAIYGLLALLTLRQKFAGKARYRPGGSWEYEPVWWTGNPEGIGGHAEPVLVGQPDQHAASIARGGARGNW
jgi:hypothetical protein